MFEIVEKRQMMCSPGIDALSYKNVPITSEALALDAAIHASQHPTLRTAGGDVAPFNLVWTNRGSDGFGVFGANAAAARSVVDAVLTQWEQIITDIHQASGNNRIDVTLSMDSSGTGVGGGAGGYVYDSNGIPTAGAITLKRGNDMNGDGVGDGNGWFIDPTPLDNAEFQGSLTNGYALNTQSGSPASGLSDLFTVVNSEIIHVLGISSDGDSKYNDSPKYSIINTADNSEGGGVGQFAAFFGPSIHHLMSTNNGGPSGSDRGYPLHGAGASGGNFIYSNELWIGAEDGMNALFENSRRYLPSRTAALIMKDGLGYSINTQGAHANGYAILNLSTGLLTIRGGEAHTNAVNSIDIVQITKNENGLLIGVDVSNDVAGTGTGSGNQAQPMWFSYLDPSLVTGIVVNTGNGNDTITVQDIGTGMPVTINAGNGNDSIVIGDTSVIYTGSNSDVQVNGDAGNDIIDINRLGFLMSAVVNGGADDDSITIGGGDYDMNIGDNITVVSSAGVDSLIFDDATDNAGNDVYNINANTFSKPFGKVTTFDAEKTTLYASGNSDTINVPTLASAHPVTLRGGNGNDKFVIGNGTLEGSISANIEMWGDAGDNSVVYEDSTGFGDDAYEINAQFLTKSSFTPVLRAIMVNNIELNANGNDNQIGLRAVLADMLVTVRGGGGDDKLLVGAGAGDIEGGIGSGVIYIGGAGVDSVDFVDTADTADPDYYTLGAVGFADEFSKLNTNTVRFSAEHANLIANGGANTILVKPTYSIPSVNAGAGNDTINIEGDNVLVNSGTGDDSLAINGDGISTASAKVSGIEQLKDLYIGAGELELVTGGTTTLDVSNSMTIIGVLDVNDNRVIRRAVGGGVNALLQLRLKAGYNNGAWNGAGPSIRSDFAAASATPFDAVGLTTAGLANLSIFGGVPVNSGDQLIGYSTYGDTDLDRDVDFDDLLRQAQNYGTAGRAWGHGDFNFDGNVNFDDLLVLAQRYATSVVSTASQRDSDRGSASVT